MNLDPQQDTPDWATEYNGTVFAPWALTADVVGLAADPPGELQSLGVQRGNQPYKDHEAWPGGFLQATDRDGVAAARREADEEASQRDLKLLDLGIYDRFGRDPRQFAGRIDPETGRLPPRRSPAGR